MSEFALLVGGKRYTGWKSISITDSLEQLAATFVFDYADRWSYQARPWPISAGAQCTVLYGGERVIVGWVDDAPSSYDATDYSQSVAGRSRTGDLVDCSAVHPGEWVEQRLDQIARDLCKPFGIDVSVACDLGAAFPKFGLEQGETVHEALERAARMRGVRLASTPAGDLLITRVGARRSSTVIERGVNVLSAVRTWSVGDRFHRYTVLGQSQGSDEWSGEAAAQLKAEATDDGARRARTLVLLAEGQEPNLDELTKRATWERNVRAGRAMRLRYRLAGWESAEGIWRANTLVRVVDSWFGVDRELVIAGVQFEKNDQGDTTTLELVEPKALSVEPLPPERQSTEEEWL